MKTFKISCMKEITGDCQQVSFVLKQCYDKCHTYVKHLS